MTSTTHQLDQDTTRTIVDMVNQAYTWDVRDTVNGRFSWRKASNVSEGLAKVLAGVSTVLAFAAGVYDDRAMSFSAGTVGTVSMVCMTLAAYASNESTQRTQQLNSLLGHLGISKVPDLTSDNSVTSPV